MDIFKIQNVNVVQCGGFGFVKKEPKEYKMNMVELEKLKEERLKYRGQVDEVKEMLTKLLTYGRSKGIHKIQYFSCGYLTYCRNTIYRHKIYCRNAFHFKKLQGIERGKVE